MGSVRPERVKRIAKMLYEKYPGRFSSDFEENKKIIESVANIPSKKFRNMIVGYVTRLAAEYGTADATGKESVEKS
ncbi:MAG: 30S ribosomal protein S17e [Nitrososphaerota archaeon]|nr:30S ribosomal protein S17e [Candidatus Bathyarchaeota archaeon]MDW8048837.1 30S ribosomal protein S17e [Nitrososphaerota archaeon]